MALSACAITGTKSNICIKIMLMPKLFKKYKISKLDLHELFYYMININIYLKEQINIVQ